MQVVNLLPILMVVVAAAEDVGPFTVLSPPSGEPSRIAANGDIAGTTGTGSPSAGVLVMRAWLGATAAGGRGGDGGALAAAAGAGFQIRPLSFAIEEGTLGTTGWTYAPKLQQDCLLQISCAGAGGDAIAVLVPLRLGSYGQAGFGNLVARAGSPPHAGVFQIPAGRTIGEALTDPANHLASLSDLLDDLTPANRPAFRLQVQPTGSWQLGVDLDGDARDDVDLTSTQPGHLPCTLPVAPGNLRLRLIPAGGAGAGKVVRSRLDVAYAAVPDSDFVHPRMQVRVPEAVAVSPVSVEPFRAGPAYTVRAAASTFAGGTAMATPLAERQTHLDLPLAPGAPTAVTWEMSGPIPTQRLTQTVEWVATDLATGEPLVIRRGDSLLLTASGSSGIVPLIIDADGDGRGDFAGRTGDRFPFRYDRAGVFQPSALVNGVPIAGGAVTVVEASLPTALASEIGFARAVQAHVAPAGAAVSFTSATPVALTVTSAVTADGPSLTVLPRRNAQAALIVRLGAAGGPILATREIDEFVLVAEAKRHLHLVEERADGSVVAEGRLTLSPLVGGLVVRLRSCTSGVTFADLGIVLDLPSDSFIRTGAVGVADYLLLGTRGDISFCHTIAVLQDGVRVSR